MFSLKYVATIERFF